VRRAAIAAVAVLAAALCALGAHDVRAWQGSLPRGERPVTALPGDPAARLLGVAGPLALRQAVQAFAAAVDAKAGFDNGVRRTRLRAVAEARLTEVAAGPDAAAASQADDLLGVLAAGGGRTADGRDAEERARDLFETAVRLDGGNAAAKLNLELALRRLQAVATREGRGNGTGPRGSGRRGAGAGTPGRGY
jgi:hypothetical protein